MLKRIKTNLRDLYFDKKHSLVLHLFLIFTVLWTRFVFLGYSDYQGDEIKAMYLPEEGQTAVEFLLEQRKGPLQFFITAVIKPFTNDYYNNFVLRFPFALAGALAVLYFYKFVKLHFGKQVALYASLFMALNGFFIGFSRIVQYQSFTILFFVMALYYFSKALFEDEWVFKGWYIGAVYWGISALSHYDAIFIVPFVIYIFAKWFKKYSNYSAKKRLLNIFGAGFVTLLIIGVFYVPFFTSLTSNQLDYWFGRLSDSTGKVSSSKYLFEIYNPIFVLELYLGLLLISLFKIKKTWPIIIWTAFPLIFMEVFTDVPGTHIYNYILPITVILGFGLRSLILLIKTILNSKIGDRVATFSVISVFLTLFLLSHTIFIDHSPEFPWQDKKFMFWTINKPQSSYHLSIFGFPYYRHWEEIETYLRENTQNKVFGTNERKSIPRFYLADFDKEGSEANHYVFIYYPQSFAPRIYQDKPYHWIRNHDMPATKVFENDGEIVVKIYEMPLGTIDDLRNMGYN